MIKKLIIMSAAFFVIFNVVAGGDDRDEGPVESLDSVQPVTDKVVVGELEAQAMTLTSAEDEALARELEEFEANLSEEARLEQELADAQSQLEAELARENALADFQAKLAEEKAAAAASNAAYQAKLAREKALADFQAKLAEEKAAAAASNAAYQARLAEDQARLAEEARLAKVIGKTKSGVEITVAAHETCQETLGLTDYNIEKFIKFLAAGTLYNEGPQLEHGTSFTPSRWDDYFDCIENLSK
jgi:vacuolar-type H+-ATPase subunit I/STV1